MYTSMKTKLKVVNKAIEEKGKKCIEQYDGMAQYPLYVLPLYITPREVGRNPNLIMDKSNPTSLPFIKTCKDDDNGTYYKICVVYYLSFKKDNEMMFERLPDAKTVFTTSNMNDALNINKELANKHRVHWRKINMGLH